MGDPYEPKSKTQTKDRGETRTCDHREPTDGSGFLHRWRPRSRGRARRRRRENRYEEVARLPAEESESPWKAASADAGSRDTAVYRKGAVRHSDFAAQHALGQVAHQSPSTREGEETRRVEGRENAGRGLYTHARKCTEKLSFARRTLFSGGDRRDCCGRLRRSRSRCRGCARGRIRPPSFRSNSPA